MKDGRAAERKGPLDDGAKRYGRETAEIDIFPPRTGRRKKSPLTRNDLSGRFE